MDIFKPRQGKRGRAEWREVGIHYHRAQEAGSSWAGLLCDRMLDQQLALMATYSCPCLGPRSSIEPCHEGTGSRHLITLLLLRSRGAPGTFKPRQPRREGKCITALRQVLEGIICTLQLLTVIHVVRYSLFPTVSFGLGDLLQIRRKKNRSECFCLSTIARSNYALWTSIVKGQKCSGDKPSRSFQ